MSQSTLAGTAVEGDKLDQLEWSALRQKLKLNPYTVKAGETLKSLAVKFYGSLEYWPRICKLNPETIQVEVGVKAGMTIMIDQVTDDMHVDPNEDVIDSATDLPESVKPKSNHSLKRPKFLHPHQPDSFLSM
ncbi:MAG: LysM peptidoglycan-binding domain-containing protein [Xanthomonadaceae bacterium]|nr:LysM peptidoglycan-binding domain-containing protein [Xanthomonadaceae bacterium]